MAAPWVRPRLTGSNQRKYRSLSRKIQAFNRKQTWQRWKISDLQLSSHHLLIILTFAFISLLHRLFVYSIMSTQYNYHRHYHLRSCGFTLLLQILMSVTAAALPKYMYQECISPTARTYQYCNASLSHVDRVEALIGVMNIEEKIASLAPDPSVGHDCNVVTKRVPRLGLGRFMWLTETNSQANSVCLNGTRCATAFPGQLGLASSFNRSVWYGKGDVISTELRGLYNSGGKRRCDGCFVGLTGFGPNINFARDPRFGRTSELP